MNAHDVLNHPDNRAVLRWLGVRPQDRLKPWAPTRFEAEGAGYLLDVIGADLPDAQAFQASAVVQPQQPPEQP